LEGEKLSETLTVKSVAFTGPDEPDRGFTIKASYLEAPHAGDALIEIFREGESYRRFLYPAYKIYNLAAHFGEIVSGEIDGSFVVYPEPLAEDVTVAQAVQHEAR
jgi:hypothetical protein